MSPPGVHRRVAASLLLTGTNVQPNGLIPSQQAFSSADFLARCLELEGGTKAGSLRRAFQSLNSSRQRELEERWGHSALDELFSLAEENDPASFMQGFEAFGDRMERSGYLENAARVYTLIRAWDPKAMPGDFRAAAARANTKLEAMAGRGSFGTRAESWFRNASLDQVTGGINHAGAVLGLATIFCSYVRPLRPLAAGGVGLLSESSVAGVLLGSGAYTLYRQTPAALAAARRLWNGTADGGPSSVEDSLLVSGYLIGALGIGVGIGSFGVAARTYSLSREAALVEGFSPTGAAKVAAIRADAVRRAVQDPEIWVQFARGQSGLQAWQRWMLSAGGQWTNRALLYGSAAVGIGKFGLGLQSYFGTPNGTTATPPGLASLLLGLAMDVSPAVTVHLYRAGRGNRNFNLGPPMSQELTERHYQDPRLREIVLRRIDRGIGSLSPAMERSFIRQANVDLLWVERALKQAERIAPLARGQGEGRLELIESQPQPVPVSPPPVAFPSNPSWIPEGQRLDVARLNLTELRQAYSRGEFSPVGVLQILLDHPAVREGAIFPRTMERGALRNRLIRLAEASQKRFETGTARPLEGVLVAVKDLFPCLEGRMHLGSKTSRVTGVESSPVVSTLLELGAIPIPVGMVAAASGGSGQHASFGYITHPNRPGLDPAGSSSATAHVIGHEELPIVAGIGTDTGGSVTAPAGAVGLFGIVPPAGVISTKNMVPFATFLDRVGVLARSKRDAMTLARLLSRLPGDDPHLRLQNPGALYQAAPQRPTIAYLESVVAKATPESRANFLKAMEVYRIRGYEVKALGAAWDFISEAPLRLYPFDAYVAGAFTHANPLQDHSFEAPRRSLDGNLNNRLPKGALSLRLGFYDQARNLSQRYEALINSKIGKNVVMASPSTEAISTADIVAGRAGARLDGHDRITMAKNRVPDWGQVSIPSKVHPEVGLAFSGSLPNLMHFTEELTLRTFSSSDSSSGKRMLPHFEWPSISTPLGIDTGGISAARRPTSAAAFHPESS